MKRADLARQLDIHPRTLQKWFREGCPDADLKTVTKWRDQRDQTTAEGRAALEAARTRKELAQAAEAEQRVAQRAGKLVAIEDVEKTWSAMVAAMRARLLALPTALADKVCRLAATEGVAAVEAALQAAVYDALRELAEDKPAKKASPKKWKPRRA